MRTFRDDSERNSKPGPGLPTIIVATIVRRSIRAFETFSTHFQSKRNGQRAPQGLDLVSRGQVSVCLCGFWLEDGTYREPVKEVQREARANPVLMVSEYRDYLAAMSAGAFDFICVPIGRLMSAESCKWQFFLIARTSAPKRPEGSIGSHVSS